MHDLSHEDLAVLHHAGEAPPEAAAILGSCPECRQLMEALRLGSSLAVRAAKSPSAALQARVRAFGPEASIPQPPRLRRALAVAVLCAAAVVVARWNSPEPHGSDDLEGDLARVQVELDALVESVSRGHEQTDFEADIRDLQGDAAALRRQLGG